MSKSGNSKKEKNKIANKFVRSSWKFIIYTILAIYGIITLFNESWIFNSFEYTLDWKDDIIPGKVKLYYSLEFCTYVINSVFLHDESNMSDYYEMLIHHIVTLLLITVSYRYK
ncbi:Ceramide synthase 4 [Astathelohania contejeani]|uniref:Ceramide synthase 4 n=1 Tax=Astathelohania contejeani TaxID=164912 RepID=A0ABQ7I2F2_9MICR|nr:Ceramide synthase 4 [Thelohania contejeani]